MEKFLSALIEGVSFGGVYALLAVGLVLAYKTSGVFNIAFGAQAFVSGAIYYQLHNRSDWPIVPAFVLAVVVAAPLLGALLDRLLFRHLRTAPPLSRLVVALGLLVAIPSVVSLFFEVTEATQYQGIVPGGDVTYRPIADVPITRDDLSIMLSAVLVAAGLTLLFRATSLGLHMRAVVESPRLTELAGIRSDLVGTSAWMLSSFVAGLAGVLLPTVFQQVSDVNYTTLLTAAIAAAALASLTSIPIAFAGGIGLGVLQQFVARYLPTDNVFASNVKPSLPFIVLFLVLIFKRSLSDEQGFSDPLATVDPPPPAPAAAVRSRELTIGTRVFGAVVGTWWFWSVLFVWNDIWLDRTIQIVIYSVIFLSVVVITGMAGQISFAQATFAGMGAFFSAQLATKQGMSVLVTILIAAGIAAAVGAVVGAIALRRRGIFLALATYAFALFFDSTMVRYDWVGGGIYPIESQRPIIGPIDFARPIPGSDTRDTAFLVLALAVLVVTGVAVIWVRNGTTGRFLGALRSSETAAASVGIHATRWRILAFALSAFIAGLGGGLLASYKVQVSALDYNANLGLFWVVIVVTLGPRTVEGAIQAAAGFVLFQTWVLPTALPWLYNHALPFDDIASIPSGWQQIFFGLGALTYAKHPEGILEHNKLVSLARIQARIDRSRAKRRGSPEAAAA